MIFISIHAPRVGGDITDVSLCRRPDNFNPRPPCGGRPCPARRRKRRWEFQSTPPVWGATLLAEGQEDILRHFNPRPPCGGRRDVPVEASVQIVISIHAPRVGGDPVPTLWVRLASYFNPRPPCGGRRRRTVREVLNMTISIHAPRVGGDYSIRQRYIDH